MRSIEYLAQLFPAKTGKELFEIQKQDKEEDQRKYELYNKSKLDFIADINTNGGYWKGTFGLNQKFYYSFSNLELIGGDILGNVKTIVVFTDGSFSVKVEEKTLQILEKYGLSIYTRTTKEDFDNVLAYIGQIPQFWD